MKKRKARFFLLIAGVFLLIAAGAFSLRYLASGGSDPGFTTASYAMGTYVQQTVYGPGGEEHAKAATREIGRLESLISWRSEDSDIARLNAAAGADWIAVDRSTAELLSLSLGVAERSGGAFDPTILPVSSLWDFGGSNEHLPEDAQIREALTHVDYTRLRVDTEESTASLKSLGMAVDLGAVGKGAACDRAVAAYRDSGARAGVIAVGGSIGLFGEKPDKTPWRLAVRDPASGESKTAAMGELSLVSGFVSTSGSYEKFFERDGTVYHHLLSPKTGYPGGGSLISVTVTAPSGALSDALSTACFLLGPEKSLPILRAYGAEAVFIGADRAVTVTEGLKDSFRITSGAYRLAGTAAEEPRP